MHQQGSGFVVPLRGGAKIRITSTANGYRGSATPTYDPADKDEAVDVSGYQTFRQVAYVAGMSTHSIPAPES